jgi:hypothetical protein
VVDVGQTVVDVVGKTVVDVGQTVVDVIGQTVVDVAGKTVVEVEETVVEVVVVCCKTVVSYVGSAVVVLLCVLRVLLDLNTKTGLSVLCCTCDVSTDSVVVSTFVVVVVCCSLSLVRPGSVVL